MDFYKDIPILDDSPSVRDVLEPGLPKGYVPRDYSVQPANTFSALPSTIKVYPRSDWDALYDEQEAKQTSLEHLYLRGGKPAFENLDQNGHGYCWSYSTGHAIMLDRLKGNQPLVRINPHATAAIIKRGKDEGGWSGLSAQWAREHGYAVQGTGPGEWPEHSRDLRYDTPELRAAMALHKVTEDFVDLTRDVYDQNLTIDQLATCLFNNQPCPVDFDWWGHAVCAVRWVRIAAGEWGLMILNSWKLWGRFGLAVIRGGKERPQGALSILVSGASDT